MENIIKFLNHLLHTNNYNLKQLGGEPEDIVYFADFNTLEMGVRVRVPGYIINRDTSINWQLLELTIIENIQEMVPHGCYGSVYWDGVNIVFKDVMRKVMVEQPIGINLTINLAEALNQEDQLA